MSLIKESYPNWFLQEINESIENLIPKIKVNVQNKLASRKKEIQRFDEWESRISLEYLDSSHNLPMCVESNLVKFSREFADSFSHIIKKLYSDKQFELSGSFYYPPTGYMGWHTNSNMPCERLYITWASKSKKSFFRYLEDGNLITDYDRMGITIRRFTITENPPYFWHCVGSECDRFSFGFRVKD